MFLVITCAVLRADVHVDLLEFVALAVGTEGEVGAAGGVGRVHFVGGRRCGAPRAEGRAAGAAAAPALVPAAEVGAPHARLVAALRLPAVQLHVQVVLERLVAANDLRVARKGESDYANARTARGRNFIISNRCNLEFA